MRSSSGLSYTRSGSGTPVVCLHGWPGAASDYRELVPLLAGRGDEGADVIVPDLLGFGASFEPSDADRPATAFGRDAQTAAVLGLLDELELGPAVFVGYDVGATTSSTIAREHPERVRGLVLGNAITPDAARYALDDEQRSEFWYQDFHELELISTLLDGRPESVRAYLDHIWGHWGARPIAATEGVTDELVAAYARPGAMTVSVNWYRSGSATLRTALALRSMPDPAPVTVPTRVVWGERDPLFPPSLATNLEAAFTDVRSLVMLPDVGHFVPLEAAPEVADAVRAFL